MRNRLFLCLGLAGIAMLSAAPADGATPPPSGFVVVASPRFANHGWLTQVSAGSASDVWATGAYGGGSPLIEHYNGSKWSVVETQHLAHMQINGVSARGAGVVWIVGFCGAGDTGVACVAHRVGSQWIRVGVPGQLGFYPYSVLAFSNTNVLVGGAAGAGQTSMIRWNGHSWSQVPVVHYNGEIRGIAGTLSDHLFAAATQARFQRELPDGSWRSTVPFPEFSEVSAISASSAENVWEVGSEPTDGSENRYPVAMRWNGTSSSLISFPTAPVVEQGFGIVSARPDDTWMVGTRYTADGGQAPLIEHYTGGSSFVDTVAPDPGATAAGRRYYQPLAIAAVPGAESDMWVVGNGNGEPLILHHPA